jgi:hypothetical protein
MIETENAHQKPYPEGAESKINLRFPAPRFRPFSPLIFILSLLNQATSF